VHILPFPKEFWDSEPFYGTYQEALKKIPNLKSYTKKLPAVIYMQGYRTFRLGDKISEVGYRGWISILCSKLLRSKE